MFIDVKPRDLFLVGYFCVLELFTIATIHVFFGTWRISASNAAICYYYVFIYFRKYFVPGTSAFVAEFLVMLGVYGNNSLVSLLCAIATVFGALTIYGCIIEFFLAL